MSTVPHSVPSRLSVLTAELYGREDDTLIAWRQTCVHATDALRTQYAGERLSKALLLAQDGAVTLEEGGCALVKSGTVHYKVHADGRCNCPDYEKRGGPCKHVLAVLIHSQTLALLEPSPSPCEPEPPASSVSPGYATVADLQRAHPTSATWNVQEAPTSACFKFRLGQNELLYTFRGIDDAEVIERIRTQLPLLQDILEVHELRAAERAAARATVLGQAQAAAQRTQAQASSPPLADLRHPLSTADVSELLRQAAAQLHAETARRDAASTGPATQPPSTSQAKRQAKSRDQETGLCSLHTMEMDFHDNERGTWYSHLLENGRYCKGAK